MVNTNNIRYEEKLIFPTEMVKINDDTFIKIELYEKRNMNFYDVTFKLKDKERFLGRFTKEFNNVKAKYKDGKILVYSEELNLETKELNITKVLSLYDILDDVFYSCTEIEALNIFDTSIDNSKLKTPDNLIYRSDLVKKKRL